MAALTSRIFEYLFMHYFHLVLYLLIGCLGFCLVRAGAWSKMTAALRGDKLFFGLLAVFFTGAAFLSYPGASLTYYDEHNYLLQAQNIVEQDVNALCVLNDAGRCREFVIAPHGMGVSAVYALLYDHDFDRFVRKVAACNFLLYLFNALLMFLVAGNVFVERRIARVACVLALSVPFSLIYATNVMPATLVNTFFLLFLYGFTAAWRGRPDMGLAETQADTERGYLILAMGHALMVLTFLRAEYGVLLGLYLASLGWAFRRGRLNGGAFFGVSSSWFVKDDVRLGLCFFSALMIAICAAHSLRHVGSLLSGTQVRLGPGYLNLSYVRSYFSNAPLRVTSLFFIGAGVFFLARLGRGKEKGADSLKAVLLGLFFFYLAFYSACNFRAVTRFIVPITSVYVLFSSAGLDLFWRAVFKKRGLFTGALAFSTLLLGVLLVREAAPLKRGLMEDNVTWARFLGLIDRARLSGIAQAYPGNDIFFFKASYLGQVTRIGDYTHDAGLAVRKMREGSNLFYVEGGFEGVGQSPFGDTAVFRHILVYRDEASGLGIYKIEPRGSSAPGM